jgi:hypothetical protein
MLSHRIVFGISLSGSISFLLLLEPNVQDYVLTPFVIPVRTAFVGGLFFRLAVSSYADAT